MFTDFITSIGLILLGMVGYLFTKKNPAKKPDIWNSDFRGYFGAIGLIILGCLWLINMLFHLFMGRF
jgi:hypothetical protein